MAKRFGRNSRRKLREEVERASSEASYFQGVSSRLRWDLESVKKRHDMEIAAARRARDMVKISVDTMLDPRERNVRIRAYFDRVSAHRGDYPYLVDEIAIDMDTMRMQDQIEREAFVTHASQLIAEHALEQMVRQWRSR
jgi:hypothetical protein